MKGKSRAMKDQIRRMFKDGHKIKKISSALGISKNTVKKYLRNDEAEETPKIEGSKEDQCHGIDWDYVIGQLAIGCPLTVIYKEIIPPISYSHFTKLAKAQSPKALPRAAIRLQHVPGERTQVDYCDGLSVIDPKTGEAVKTQFFCGVLPASSFVFGEFTFSHKSKDFLRSHENMWHYFGGVSQYVVVDNLKSGVTKAHRYDPELNPAYCDFANHCGFAVLPARVRTPRDKACVEATIGVIQRDFFETFRNHKFYSLFELNQKFRTFLNEFNLRIMSDYGVSRFERFEAEKSKLGPLPESRYEFFEWKKAKVHPDCCIELKTSVYSVPFTYIGKMVLVKYSDNLVLILDETGTETIATHSRAIKYKPSILEEHLPPYKTQREAFSFRSIEAVVSSIGPETAAYVTWQMEQDPYPLQVLRRMQGLVRFYQSSKPSKEAMEFAAKSSRKYSQRKLRYFKSCIDFYGNQNTSPNKVKPPQRELANIHLQEQEYPQ
jgi:transposase